MIKIHSKYDNMHRNGMFCVLIFINNHIITSINFMSSRISHEFDMYIPIENNFWYIEMN